MKPFFLILGLSFFFVGCATIQKTGADFNRIGPGMNQAQVMEIMGNPDTFGDVNGYSAWQWNYRPVRSLTFTETLNSSVEPLSDNRSIADYYVIYKNGQVVQKGTGSYRESSILSINANVRTNH